MNNSKVAVPSPSSAMTSWTIAGLSYTEWLTRLVLNLLNSGWVNDEALLLLSSVCKVKMELCQWVFPLVVHNILSTDREECMRQLSTEVSDKYNKNTMQFVLVKLTFQKHTD